MDPSSASQKPDKPSKWYYGIVPVLMALFLLGPFGFPLLWKSPRFNRFWKILLTVAVCTSTLYMLWGTWAIVKIILDGFKKEGLI